MSVAPKPHTYPRAGIPLLCVKLQLTSISASVVPMRPAWNWSSVPTETMAGNVPQLTSETVQVCSLIKAWQNDTKREKELASEHEWQPSLMPALLSPPASTFLLTFRKDIISYFSFNLWSPVPRPLTGAHHRLLLCIGDCHGWGFWFNWRQQAPV